MTDPDRRTGIQGDQIENGTIRPSELQSIEQASSQMPTDGDILSWNETEDKFEWIPFASNLIGKQFSLNFFNPGSTGNKWLYRSFNANTTYDVPVYMALDVSLIAIMYSNKEINKDIDLEFYQNGIKIYTEQIRNTKHYRKSSISSLFDLDIGDKFSIYAKQIGGNNPSDVILDLIFRVRTNDIGTGSSN